MLKRTLVSGRVVNVSIVVEDYHKSYGSFIAVRGLSLSVSRP
jgi:hypothetical protein